MQTTKQDFINALQGLITASKSYAEKHPDHQANAPQDEDWNIAFNHAEELLEKVKKEN